MEIAEDIYTARQVYSLRECQEFIDLSEEIGYQDAPISMFGAEVRRPDVRNNARVILDSAAPSAKKLVLTGTVTAISQVYAKPPSLGNWAVTIRVEKVKAVKYSGPEFTFTIHSPARAGLAVGRRCTIEATWTGQEYVVDETRWMGDEDAGR